jgi:V8-like Glu-specific endopeptidase
MRSFLIGVACAAGIAGVVGSGGVQAELVPAGVSPFPAGPAISKERMNAPAGLLKGYGLPKPSPDEIRLAQLKPANTGNPSVAPLKWVGVLINPTPSKQHPNAYSWCTAQFIKPNVLLTAGHCIKDLQENPTGPWYDLTKQYFVLQYQNGEGSQKFMTKCAAANPKWTFPSTYGTMTSDQQNTAFLAASQHDFAMVLVDANSPTGVMPYALDWKGNWKAATRVGYAGDILDGQIIQDSHGIVFFADAIPMFGQSFPSLVVHWQSRTDLTSGTSGGGWIANFSGTESATNNTLIAVTSFSDSGYPGAEMATYLTAAEFNPLLTYVSNGCK